MVLFIVIARISMCSGIATRVTLSTWQLRGGGSQLCPFILFDMHIFIIKKASSQIVKHLFNLFHKCRAIQLGRKSGFPPFNATAMRAGFSFPETSKTTYPVIACQSALSSLLLAASLSSSSSRPSRCIIRTLVLEYGENASVLELLLLLSATS